jgi:hypothetical protein
MGAASGLLMGFTWGMAGVLYIGIGALQEADRGGPAMASRSSACSRRPLAARRPDRHRAAIDAAD